MAEGVFRRRWQTVSGLSFVAWAIHESVGQHLATAAVRSPAGPGKREVCRGGQSGQMPYRLTPTTTGQRRSRQLRQRLAEELLSARVEAGISRRKLARIVGVSPERVARVERGDPTAQTPCANVTGVASMGIMQVVTDPRTTFAQSLNAVLIAELADNAGRELLISLAEQAGETDIAQKFQRAMAEEEEHLVTVKAWLTALVTAPTATVAA